MYGLTMTRQKKSRKIGQIGVRKQDARPEKKTPNLRKKKSPKGQKSGNRNSLMEEKVIVGGTATTAKKDPKLGSKKKIELTPKPVQEAPVKTAPNTNKKPEVKLKKVEQNAVTPEQELAVLENDEKLIDFAERVEAGELLTGKDAKYFNKHMARYEELCKMLGIEDEDDVDPLNSDQWDDLLDK
jgi:ribosome assembly protein YihI (activator of Der GTPase)